MPLFALLHYVRERGNSRAVDRYGIAVLKSEFFKAGGRPVIYGLSGKHLECGSNAWPRLLDDSCGIKEHEQYRYVAMNLSTDHPIDWSHEREWRWADGEDKFECPGLPVWLQNPFVSFSTMILIVPTSQEAERVLDKLKLMRDAKTDEYCNLYDTQAVVRTRVLAIEEVHEYLKGGRANLLRIDDIPVHRLKEAVPAVPNQELVIRVKNAVEKAKQKAIQAAAQWRAAKSQDVFGFAYLMIGGPRTEVVEAMLQIKEINEIAMSDGFGYRLANIGGNCETHYLGEAEAAVNAAMIILEQEFPKALFYTQTVWD